MLLSPVVATDRETLCLGLTWSESASLVVLLFSLLSIFASLFYTFGHAHAMKVLSVQSRVARRGEGGERGKERQKKRGKKGEKRGKKGEKRSRKETIERDKWREGR